MALSKTKIARMVADWKTGLYSERKMAERHKVSRKSIRKYCPNHLKGINADLVHEVAKVEIKKESIKGPEKRALEDAVKQLTFEEKVREDVLKKSLAITQQAVTKSMQKIAKDKGTTPSELHEHVKIAQRARMIVRDDQQQQPQTSINVQQLMLSEQQQMQEQTQSVEQMDEERLIQEFKRRGLPIADNSAKAELQRLGMI